MRNEIAERRGKLPTSEPNRRIEHALLLCCAKVGSEDQRSQQIRDLLAHCVDWSYLLTAAHVHGLTPLLYCCLRSGHLDSVPANTIEKLRDNVRKSAARNLLLTGELFRLSELLQANEIAHLPFKGPALAVLAYHNLALRPFNDLDFLVREADIPKVTELMFSRGYRLSFHPNKTQEKIIRWCENHYLFTRQNNEKIVVEFHWKIAPACFPFAADSSMFWAELMPVSIAGKTISTFSTENLLLFLCAHGAKHLWWGCLEWLCDVARVIDMNGELDWQRILNKSRRLHCQTTLLLGLLLAHELLGAPLPNQVAQQASAQSLRALAAEVQNWVMPDLSQKPGFGQMSWFYIRVQDRLQERLRSIFYAIVTPSLSDWKLLPHPAFSCFCPVTRPFRLIGKGGFLWLKRLYKNWGRGAIRVLS